VIFDRASASLGDGQYNLKLSWDVQYRNLQVFWTFKNEKDDLSKKMKIIDIR